MRNCYEKFVGIGRYVFYYQGLEAGTEARPTQLFMLCGWASGP